MAPALALARAERRRLCVRCLLAVSQLLFLMRIMESFGFISNEAWLEGYIDFLSVQATMFNKSGVTWWDRMRTHVGYYRRVEDR